MRLKFGIKSTEIKNAHLFLQLSRKIFGEKLSRPLWIVKNK